MRTPRFAVNKRGQIQAAILIALIMLFFIIYIIFLPTEDRERLLDENRTRPSRDEGRVVEVLLREFPGTLTAVKGVENEKELPNVYLIQTSNAKELAGFNSFVIGASSFDQKKWTGEFTVDDPANTDNIFLTFRAKKSDGVLSITLNDKIIFENELSDGAEEQVSISPRDIFRQNTIEFSVAKTGPRFWNTDQYSIEKARIIGEIADPRRQASKNVFVLSNDEFANLDEATLKFIPYCKGVSDVGRLEIQVNGQEIFSAIPVCDDPYRQVIPKNMLRSGENTIEFKTSKGSYSVEQIVIALEYRSARIKPYFFELTQNQREDINESINDLRMTLRFTDDEDIKDLIVDINGHKKSIDTSVRTYTRKINATDTIEGNNFIRLIPVDRSVDVAELKVELVR